MLWRFAEKMKTSPNTNTDTVHASCADSALTSALSHEHMDSMLTHTRTQTEEERAPNAPALARHIAQNSSTDNRRLSAETSAAKVTTKPLATQSRVGEQAFKLDIAEANLDAMSGATSRDGIELAERQGSTPFSSGMPPLSNPLARFLGTQSKFPSSITSDVQGFGIFFPKGDSVTMVRKHD